MGRQLLRQVEAGVARYGKEHKQGTRRRIIDAAGRRLKRDGIDGSGIATLMADAGLTNGAFYAHFQSKDDLVANALEILRVAALSSYENKAISSGVLLVDHDDGRHSMGATGLAGPAPAAP